MDLRPDEITGLIKSRIKNYNAKIQLGDVGTVVTVGDGIVRIHGLEKCMLNELLEFENGVQCMAMNLEQDFVGAVMLGSDEDIKEGSTVFTLIVCTICTGISHIGLVNDLIAYLVVTITVNTCRIYHFFSWEVIDLVWHPVSNGLNTVFMEGTKNVKEVLK